MPEFNLANVDWISVIARMTDRRLSPLLRNVGKRLARSPKLYVRDSGIVHALLGVIGREEFWKGGRGYLRLPSIGRHFPSLLAATFNMVAKACYIGGWRKYNVTAETLS